VVNATSTCYKSSCVTGVQPVFDPASWRDGIRLKGSVDDYDEQAYEKNKVAATTPPPPTKPWVITLTMIFPVLAVVIVPAGIGAYLDGRRSSHIRASRRQQNMREKADTLIAASRARGLI